MTGDLERGVSNAVTLERRPRSMKGVAVQLNDEVPIQPGRVDLEAGHAHVDRWLRQPSVAAEVDEQPLQL